MSDVQDQLGALLAALSSEPAAIPPHALNRTLSDVEREELVELCGFEDEVLLRKLIAAGVTPRTFAALRFVPLVLVAWADGDIHEDEREAVLRATVDVTGIGWGTRAYHLLEAWLEVSPDEGMVTLWRDYAKSLARAVDATARRTLRNRILGDAYQVAYVSGGLLGIGRVSEAEERTLASLEAVFD